MHTFDIESADDVTLYIAWKIMNLSLEANHPTFHDFLYDLPNTIKAGDFSEQNNMTRNHIYLRHIRKIFQLGLIKNLRIRVIKNINQGCGIYEVDIPVDIRISPSDILMHNRGSEHARFISGEFSQHEIINISGIHKLHDEYRTCFLFEPDYDRITEYIHQYLLLWGEEKLLLNINYIRPERQIESFHKILQEKVILYGDTFKYTVSDHKNLSEITLILYFSYILGTIEMQGWDDNIMRTNNIINVDPITFKIKSKLEIELKAATKITEAKIHFDEHSGIFSVEGEKIGLIKVDTQQFHFFKCLYENFPNAVEHQKIVRYLVNGKAESGDNKAKYSSQHSTYLSNIKKNINKDILKYIISPKGNYQLLDSPSS